MLVLVLTSGVAAQSPSAATPTPFVADDLASTIPTTVGDYGVAIEAGPLDVDVYEDAWRDLLQPLGKDTSDVQTADGYGFPAGDEEALARDGPAFQVSVMRVDGVPAAELVEPMVGGILEGMPAEYQAFARVDWQVIDGRDVYSIVWTPALLEQVEGGNTESGIYHYANGQILFQVVVPPYHPAGSPALTEILARLP